MLAALRSLDALTDVAPLVDKYIKILDLKKGKRPTVQIQENLGSRWLGRCIYQPNNPNTTVIVIQKSVLGHPVTLERVVAHEVCHHAEFMEMNDVDFEMARQGLRPDHGPEWLALANKINAVAGPGFITKHSDSEYVRDKSTKPYYLFIVPMPPNGERLGYNWCGRLTTPIKEWVRKAQAMHKAKLIRSTESQWIERCTHRLGTALRGHCIPKEPERQKALRLLYEKGENLGV